VALLFGAPETYAPTLLTQKAKRVRASTGDQGYYAKHEQDLAGKSLSKTVLISGTRVFSLLVLEPMLLLLCVWCAVLLGILYLFFELYREYVGKYTSRIIVLTHYVLVSNRLCQAQLPSLPDWPDLSGHRCRYPLCIGYFTLFRSPFQENSEREWWRCST
jgi:hypothetical protein